MNQIAHLINSIDSGDVKPIYFLMGDEPYFIDKISEHIQNKILSEAEKEFDQTITYGRDISIEQIVLLAKRFPILAERQLIIVKEAQYLSNTIDKIESYASNPQNSTVLVFNYKYKKLDKRKKTYKTIAKNGLLFESKKLYENQVVDWIVKFLANKEFAIQPQAAQMLVAYLGTDLSKINNELEKLLTVLSAKTTISSEHIEKNIGISKNFNNFELLKAIGQRNIVKANQIINYFAENPKNNPLVMSISLLFSFFTQLFVYHSLIDKSKNTVAKTLKINPYFVDDYVSAAKNYPMRKVSQIISLLRDADLKSKGIGANSLPQSAILKELLFKILH
ncbi:MAG: DNA polymerase III subunit delta [Tenacibaculum sp.]